MALISSLGETFTNIGRFFMGGGKWAEKFFWKTRLPYQVNSGKIYLNTMVPYKIYNSIPEFRITIDKLAAMISNGVFKWNPDGTDALEELKPDIKALLDNPNVLQSQNAFLKLWMKQKMVYGNAYIFKNQPSKIALPKTLQVISPVYLAPVLTGKVFDQIDMEGIVQNYEYTENGSVKTFLTSDVLWSKTDDLDNPLIGSSPLMAIQFPVSNTELAYKYLNCISGEKGNIGILSSTPQKDGMGSLPMNSEEKKKLEQQYRQENGIEEDQKKIAISSTPLSWQPMTYPTGQLLLLEQNEANFKTILSTYKVNVNVFINTTFTNVLEGLKMTHNDAVQPEADELTQNLTKWLGLKGGKLVLDYSHMPYLQSNKKEEAETVKTVSDSMDLLVKAGIIGNDAAKNIIALTLKMPVDQLVDNSSKISNALSKLAPALASAVIETLTINEARSLINLPDHDGGDAFLNSSTPVQNTDAGTGPL